MINNSLHQIKKNGYEKNYLITEESDTVNLLRFKDTAGGCDAKIIDNLFEGYRTSKDHGTGIGLAFCKMTMKQFDGNITCNLQDKESLEFILSFPKINTFNKKHEIRTNIVN